MQKYVQDTHGVNKSESKEQEQIKAISIAK